MKIAVYEMREDEIKEFYKAADELKVEIVTTKEALNSVTISFANGCDGVTTLGHSILDRDMLQQLKAMGIKYISTRSIGFNHIDIEAAKELGLRVSNASYAPNGVADYTIMLILMTLRNYKPALWRGQVNDYSLEGLQGREMRHLTIGVMGTGKIGKTVIQNLTGFGCKILAYDLYQNEEVKKLATYVDLETLYKECDVITLHTPLLDSTYRIINKAAIEKMKRGVVLINCARGELMNIQDIIEGIEEEKIGALGLDVFENEEGIYHQDRRTHIIKNREMAYLRQFPNVILTQHMAFYTDEAVKSMVRCGVKSLLEFQINGQSVNQIV
ncbi:lactate dehydrogenase [Clostridium sp. 19966]|uniref:D-isomer specific 2-hydroxyacid dehydrogenase family protein n=1 Tax=Clostridium sp. 19966 TaxID=2768166 RepID=UPI0028DFE266|nr:D-isomer specific 2-hydroxyacid dehydrogenase family protein [Clostridium sp. 19966]MDT8717774.1 lactate dehydrogenase [Clostridium sp. 19966]